MGNVIDLKEVQKVGESVCANCGYSWTSMAPVGVYGLECLKCGEMTGGLSEGLPELRLDDDFGDPEILFNLRGWLREAIESKGGKFTGGCSGGGEVELDIEIEGYKYLITAKAK